MIVAKFLDKHPLKHLLLLLPLALTTLTVQSEEVDVERASQLMVDDGQGGYILEDFIVRRSRGISGVVIEQDGSYSLVDFKPSVLFSALNSGSGAAVNFQLSFARHSVVLTADGHQELEDIARGIRLIGKETSFKLSIHRYANQDPSGRKSLTENRANVVMNTIKISHGIVSEISLDYISPPNIQKNKSQATGKLDYLGVTIVNEGSTDTFVR